MKAEKHRPSEYVKNLSEFKCDNYRIKKTQGRHGGTYANELGVYWYASKISEEFEVAVFTSFKAAANGQSLEASLIANSVAIPEALIAETKKLELKMKELVANATVKGLIIMHGHEVSNFSKLAQRATSGYASKQLTGGRSSFVDYIVNDGHLPALGAYKATLELVVMLMSAGVHDYHVIASALKVETTKNKEVFKLALVA